MLLARETLSGPDSIERPGPNPEIDPIDVALFRRIDAGLDREAVLAELAGRHGKRPEIPGDNIYQTLQTFHQHATPDAVEAHAELVERHTPLANFVARRFATTRERLDVDDLKQEAWLALSRGMWSFDIDRGNKPSTLLYKAISNRFLSIIAANDFPVKITTKLLQFAESHQYPDDSELIAYLASLPDETKATDDPHDTSKKEPYKRSRREAMIDLSRLGRRTMPLDLDEIDFDNVINENDGVDAGDRSSEALDQATLNHGSVMEAVEYVHVYRGLGKTALCTPALNQDEKRVLREYYGFNDGIGKTHACIATELGVTTARIGQIKAKAISKARLYLEHLGKDAMTMNGGVDVPYPVRDAHWQALANNQPKLHAYGRLEAHLAEEGREELLYALPRFARLLTIPEGLTDDKAAIAWVMRGHKIDVSAIPHLEVPIVYDYIQGMLDTVDGYIKTTADKPSETPQFKSPEDLVRFIVENKIRYGDAQRGAVQAVHANYELAAQLPDVRVEPVTELLALQHVQPLFHALGDFKQELSVGPNRIPGAKMCFDTALEEVFGYTADKIAGARFQMPPDMTLPANRAKLRTHIERRTYRQRR